MRVSRGQMASFLARFVEAAGGQLPVGSGRFTDLARNEHADAVESLAAAGIVNGRDATTFARVRWFHGTRWPPSSSAPSST